MFSKVDMKKHRCKIELDGKHLLKTSGLPTSPNTVLYAKLAVLHSSVSVIICKLSCFNRGLKMNELNKVDVRTVFM